MIVKSVMSFLFAIFAMFGAGHLRLTDLNTVMIVDTFLAVVSSPLTVKFTDTQTSAPSKERREYA
jgi:hypothetical protein